MLLRPARPSSSMPMILLRHGQSEFNLHFTRTRVDPGIEDPKLTPLGHEQAERAAVELAGAGLRRILVSPYTRALQTAAPIARALGIPVFVTSAVRERYAFVCDIGSPRSDLMQTWPDHDFAAIDERWWPTEEEPNRRRDRPRRDLPHRVVHPLGLGPHARGQPLGLHPLADRPQRRQRRASRSTPPRRRRQRSSGSTRKVCG